MTFGHVGRAVRRVLSLSPEAGTDLDDPATTAERRGIIARKAFLRRLYGEWYAAILRAVPAGARPILEIGSGGGFFGETSHGIVTSDVLCVSHVDVVLSALQLPFRADSFRAIVMTNVMHHLPDVTAFFADAARIVPAGGAVVAIEPWVTRWSSFVYQNLHHEPFAPSTSEWRLPTNGPLTSANGALPWILFERDRERFEALCAPWRVSAVEPLMPLSYLLSGGVSMHGLLPGFAYGPWRWIERTCLLERRSAMFALITLTKGGPA